MTSYQRINLYTCTKISRYFSKKYPKTNFEENYNNIANDDHQSYSQIIKINSKILVIEFLCLGKKSL